MSALALDRLRAALLSAAVCPCLSLVLSRTGLTLIRPLLRPAGLVSLTLGPSLLESARLSTLTLRLSLLGPAGLIPLALASSLLESAGLVPLALASSLLKSAGLAALTLELSLLGPSCLALAASVRTLLARNCLGVNGLYGLPRHPLGTQSLYRRLALAGSSLTSGLLTACQRLLALPPVTSLRRPLSRVSHGLRILRPVHCRDLLFRRFCLGRRS